MPLFLLPASLLRVALAAPLQLPLLLLDDVVVVRLDFDRFRPYRLPGCLLEDDERLDDDIPDPALE